MNELYNEYIMQSFQIFANSIPSWGQPHENMRDKKMFSTTVRRHTT